MGQGTPSKEVVLAGLGDQPQPDPMGVGGPPEQEKPRGSPTTDKGWSPCPRPAVPGRGCPCVVGIVCLQAHVVRQVLAPPAQGRFLEEGRL